MTRPRLMLDVCAGLGGASAAMRAQGWRVVTVDIDPSFNPDVVADVRTWSWHGERPFLVWCSPPCDEFARESMPWCKTGRAPDTSIVAACRRIIAEVDPVYWVIENVRGAVPYLGKPAAIVGPFYLWGNFPDIGSVPITWRKKESRSSSARAARAMIPAALSLAFALAIERQQPLPMFAEVTR